MHFELEWAVVYSGLNATCIKVNGSRLSTGKCISNKSNSFKAIRIEDQKYQLKHIESGLCIESNEHLTLRDCSSNRSQVFQLSSFSSNPNLSELKLDGTSRCLTVDLIAPELDVLTKPCDGSIFQAFLIAPPKQEIRVLPRKIWTYWDKGYNAMPEFYKSNVETWSKILGPDWEIVVLNSIPGDQNHFSNYTEKDSIPTTEFIASKIGKSNFERKLNALVIQSDFIRLDILYRQGGFWLDPSIMLHRTLDSFRIPLQFLGDYTVAGYTNINQAISTHRYVDGLENFFIAALPESRLIKLWKESFLKYWTQKLPDQRIHDSEMFRHNQSVKLKFPPDLKEYLNQHAALKYTFSVHPELSKEVFILSDVGTKDRGPFGLLKLFDWEESKLVELNQSSFKSVWDKLKPGIMTKFPSENSREIRKRNYAYFFDDSDIFGFINKHAIVSKQSATSASVPKLVWTFWDKGEEKMPAFNRFNVWHWRTLLEPLGFEIRITNLVNGDDNNVFNVLEGTDLLPNSWDSLQNLKSYIGTDGHLVKAVPSIVKSDFIRLALLEKFGGVWMDSSNVLIDDLNHIALTKLDNTPEREIAGYVMDSYSSDGSPEVDGKKVDGLENWFIAAKSNSSLIKNWRKYFQRYWDTRVTDQHIHLHKDYQKPGFTFGGLGIAAANYLNQHGALKYLLFKKPELGQKIYPLQHMHPWWFHDKAGGSSAELYQGFVSVEVDHYVEQIRSNQVQLLKFAGPHLVEINQHFSTLPDFCHKRNLLRLLYGNCPF